MPASKEPYSTSDWRTSSGAKATGGSPGRSAETGAAPVRKVIRTDRVRYPGVDQRIGADSQYQEWRDSGKRLRPMRDAGLYVERKNARELRRVAKTRRRRALVVIGVLAVVVAAAFAWQSTSDRRAVAEQLKATAQLERTGAHARGVQVAVAAEPVPSPVFATYKKLKLHLPMALADLSEVAFHQASYSYALPLKTHLPKADMGDAKKNRGTNRDDSAQEPGDEAPLTGEALVMWRDRPGKPDTAVDIGAAAGATVLAPVSGTIVLVKKYDLYNKYPDVQLHIQPDGYPNIDVVVIHFTDPKVRAGDRVVAGITPVGKVRKLSDKINLQLRSYTKDGGNHVHVQINDSKDPSYEGLDGALKVITESD